MCSFPSFLFAERSEESMRRRFASFIMASLKAAGAISASAAAKGRSGEMDHSLRKVPSLIKSTQYRHYSHNVTSRASAALGWYGSRYCAGKVRKRFTAFPGKPLILPDRFAHGETNWPDKAPATLEYCSTAFQNQRQERTLQHRQIWNQDSTVSGNERHSD